MLREDDLDEAKETAETKDELTVKTCAASCKSMQDLRGWPAVVDSWRSA